MDMYESEHVFFPLNINGKDEIFLLSTSVNNIKTYIEVQLSWFPLILTWVSYLSSSSSERHDAEGEVGYLGLDPHPLQCLCISHILVGGDELFQTVLICRRHAGIILVVFLVVWINNHVRQSFVDDFICLGLYWKRYGPSYSDDVTSYTEQAEFH